MAGNEIKLTFAGDSKQLERSFDRVGDAAKDMADDLKVADKEAGRFSGGIGTMNEKIGDAESKFMGTADLVDGLAGAFGISLGPTVEYARAFGDMAGGFSATLGPAMESISGKLGKLTFVTKMQTVAQQALNAVMRGNPIFLVITALTLLTAGFILAYKKSETFRAVVHGAMNGVKTAVKGAWDMTKNFFDAIADGVSGVARTMGRVADIITTPYQLAFRAIASLWNNTVGRLHVSIPGFMGFGGISFDVPDIPMLAAGGTARGGRPHIVGERGPELFIPNQTGTVVPNGGFGGAARVDIVLSGDAELVQLMRRSIRTRGGNVQVVLGSA